MTTKPIFRSVASPLDVTDEALTTLNQRLGVPSLVRQAVPEKPRAPLRAINLHLPDYLAGAIKKRAFETDASVRYVVMKALSEAGFAVDPADLVHDGRRAG